MRIKKFILALVMFSSGLAQASPAEEIDKLWVSGQPWPATWGRLTNPIEFEWNRVFVAFVNNVYDKDFALSTFFKDIPYALEKDATVEICMLKKGVFSWPTLCRPAIVEPTIKGTIKDGDVVAVLHAYGGNSKWFNNGPGTDPRKALRVIQVLAPKEDDSCWHGIIIKEPNDKSCLARFNGDFAEEILVRDFGPRMGSSLEPTLKPQ